MAFSVIFIPKTPKFIKIQLKISAIPQNHAKFMQNITSWRENLFLLRKSWFSGGGVFSPPPWYTSIKKSPGINRVNQNLLFFQVFCYFKSLDNSWIKLSYILISKNFKISKKFQKISKIKNFKKIVDCINFINSKIVKLSKVLKVAKISLIFAP